MRPIVWASLALAFLLGTGGLLPTAGAQTGPSSGPQPGFVPFAGDRERQRFELEPYGLTDVGARWPSSVIAVCWVSPEGQYIAQKALVRDALSGPESQFMRFTRVRFTGWGTCTAGTDGISITIADENPWSEVGPQREQGFLGGRRRTRMLLNFDFRSWPCPDPQHCIVAIARHEFMHAIGILHEHLRPDAPKACGDLYAGRPDNHGTRPVAVGAYDPDSIMNYCNNIYDTRRPPLLSPIDLMAVNYLYPPG